MAKYSFYSNKLHKVFETVEELKAAEKAATERETRKIDRKGKIEKLKKEISELDKAIEDKAKEIGRLVDEERKESEKEGYTFYKKDGNGWKEICGFDEIVEDILKAIR